VREFRYAPNIMGVRIERAAGWAYASWSVIVLLVWLFVEYGPFWHRDVFVLAEQDVPLQWYEYVGNVASSLLLAALYGCVTLVFLLNRRRAAGIPIVFASFAVVIGGIALLFGVIGNALAHMDCGDHCVAYIPDADATTALNLALLVCAVLPPAAFLIAVIAGRVIGRRERATAAAA